MNTYRIFLAAGVLTALSITPGCATREWVQSQMEPVASRVAQNDERLTKAENQLGNLGGRMKVVEVKVGDFDGKLASIDARAQQALDTMSTAKLERQAVVEAGATFKPNSSNLAPSSKKDIDAIVAELKRSPNGTEGVSFIVAGHTDNAGSHDYNYALGQKRANAVANYLVGQKHVDRGRVMPVSYGETAPLLDNSTAKGREVNRRVEILVYREGATPAVAANSATTQPLQEATTTPTVEHVSHRQ
ncbi:MAG: OmpA family protein [Burkholderiales bacterium]|nr:OmpA family protein [Burkholderiales bacterium]